MSVLDSILSNTVGFGWRAVTGTVDPWTKNNQIEQSTFDYLQAQGIDPSTATPDQIAEAKNQANTDTTKTLTSDNADPTQASTGISSSLKKFENYIVIGLILIIAIYLGGQYLKRGRN